MTQPATDPSAAGPSAGETAAGPDASPTAVQEQSSAPVLVPLHAPRDGVPVPVETPQRLAEAVGELASGDGPVAVDVERASGYRYSQRAYLVQLRRSGAGTVLVDPLPFAGLAALQAAVGDEEWVLHAASQDLPSLAGEGLRPRVLFDTELAGRLLGFPRVGLGAMVADVLGYALEKGHSAADWSTRPLPEPWLRYAALDVELLLDLRDALEGRLAEAGKLTWAREEFAALAAAPPPAPRPEPWRRTSGVHRLRRPRQLAAVRALWEERDRIARDRDVAPGRILPDPAIIEAAQSNPASQRDLVALAAFRGRGARRYATRWLAALEVAAGLPDDALPSASAPPDGPPPPRSWAERDPAAATRLGAARSGLSVLAAELDVPLENLLAPDIVRRLAWAPPDDLDETVVSSFLREHGARPWQVAVAAPVLADALVVTAADPA